MRISDWSSDVCSSDLPEESSQEVNPEEGRQKDREECDQAEGREKDCEEVHQEEGLSQGCEKACRASGFLTPVTSRSAEHTTELQSLMRNSYAVFCLKKKKTKMLQET